VKMNYQRGPGQKLVTQIRVQRGRSETFYVLRGDLQLEGSSVVSSSLRTGELKGKAGGRRDNGNLWWRTVKSERVGIKRAGKKNSASV